jgi:site-specific recombinase XerC
VTVTTKFNKVMHGKLDRAAMARMRAHLNVRPETHSTAMFVTDDGQPLSYYGGRMIWRRMRRRSGVKRIGSHLIRHSLAQHMARETAPLSDISGRAGAQLGQDVQALRRRGQEGSPWAT